MHLQGDTRNKSNATLFTVLALSTFSTVAKDSQTAAQIDFHQRYAVHSQQTSRAGEGRISNVGCWPKEALTFP